MSTDDVVTSESEPATEEYSSIEVYLGTASVYKLGRSKQYNKTGGFNQANEDFDALVRGLSGTHIKDHSDGIRSAELPDNSTISVRPTSSSEKSTVQINPPRGRKIKVRYND